MRSEGRYSTMIVRGSKRTAVSLAEVLLAFSAITMVGGCPRGTEPADDGLGGDTDSRHSSQTTPQTTALPAESERVRDLLSEAVDVAAKIDDESDADDVLSSVASVYADAGDAEAAIETALSMTSGFGKGREGTLARIAASLAQRDDVTGALSAANRIERFTPDKAQALAAVAPAQARAGNVDEALATADDVKKLYASSGAGVTSNPNGFATFEWAKVVSAVASALSDCGMVDEARQAVGLISDVGAVGKPWDQGIALETCEALAAIACSHIANGDPEASDEATEEALDVAVLVGEPMADMVRCQVAKAYVGTGQTDMALAEAAKISDEGYYTDVLLSLANRHVEAGDDAGATGIARQARSGDGRQSIRCAVAKSLAGAGRFDPAVKVAASIEDPAVQTDALVIIAEHQIESGDREAAVATLHMARQTLTEVGDAQSATFLVGSVAAALAAAGLPDEATALADTLRGNRFAHGAAFRKIAAAQLAAGHRQAGRASLVHAIGDGQPYNYGLAAQFVAEAGAVDDAAEWARSVDDRVHRAHALIGVARGLVDEAREPPGAASNEGVS